MKKIMSLLITLVASTMILGCGGAGGMNDGGEVAPVTLLEGMGYDDLWRIDPYELKSVSISGDTISIGVTYSGGCEEHGFELMVGTYFYESDPVRAPVQIDHDAYDDQCEVEVTETLLFDLSELKQLYRDEYGSENGTVVLDFRDSPGSSVEYVF